MENLSRPGPIDFWIIETVPVNQQGMTVRPVMNGGMYQNNQPELNPVNYIRVENINDSIRKSKP